MANLILAPEDDDSYSPLDLGPSPRKRVEPPTEMQKLHGRFDPKKIGFGIIAPWPGTELAIRGKDGSVCGNLFDGKDRKEKE